MNRQQSHRLTRADWLQTGLEALASDGPAALAAEPLARRLGTTKGSFYWHFSDLPTFQAALVAQWEVDAIRQADETLTNAPNDVSRLRLLAQIITSKPDGDATYSAPTEPAMRAWALSDAAVAAAIERVDETRIGHLRQLLQSVGVSNPEMPRIIYGASLGMEAIAPSEPAQNTDAVGTLVDLVLALR